MPQALASYVGLALFQAGASLAVVNAVTFALAGTIGRIAIGIGASLVAGALFRAPRTPAIKPAESQTEIQNEVAPRRVTIGTMRVSGARFWARTVTSDPDTLYLGWVINHGRIEAVTEWRIDDNPVAINAGTGEVLTEPYNNNGSDEVHYILHRLGLATETKYSELNTNFSVDEARGDGLATILAKFNNWEDAETQIEVFPHGLPTVTATIQGQVLFDPRDAAHDRTDETTWEYSDNPVVFLLNYMFVLADGFGMPWERVADNLAEWEAAMDACDAAVDLNAGGTESRYRCAFSYYLTDDPVDVVARALATCDGRIWTRRTGQIGITVGVFTEPTVTIESRDIVGAEITRGQDRLDAIEAVVASYLSPDHGYKEQQAESWPTAAIAAALTEDRALALDLSAVPSHTQARRLMKRSYTVVRPDWHGTITTNLAGLRAIDERYIRVRLDALDIDTTFEVRSFEFDPAAMQVTMEISQVESTIDDWDEATEEGTAPSIPEVTRIISVSIGTRFGDMTAQGGLAAAFDGQTSESAGFCAAKTASTAFIGKTFTSPRIITGARMWPSNNLGFDGGGAITMTFQLRGSNGSAPANAAAAATDGDLLATVSLGADTGSVQSFDASANETAYDNVWMYLSFSSGANEKYVAEIELTERVAL